MTTHSVIRRAVSGHQVRLVTERGDSLLARRFIPVSSGTTLSEVADALFVTLDDGSNVQVSPAWQRHIAFPVGQEMIPLHVKEIESSAELNGFLRLTKYHYRGARGAGRTVPLVVTTSSDELPEVLGFIELATSFLVNSARQKVLDTPFSDTERGVGWIRWDGVTARQWVNCIARISRCVVFPEFRGLGLSSVLVDSAVQYATERWHVGGKRPLFLEITADMLRYWPFVQRAGFLYIGDTEGNGHRAAQDMRYLIQRAATASSNPAEGMPRGGGGILSLQRSRATYLRQVVEQTGLSLEEVINHLRLSPDKLSDEEWLLLHTAYRRPKPTYLRGLTSAAHSFLSKRVAALQVHSGERKPQGNLRNRNHNDTLLSLRGLTIVTRSKPVSSRRSRRVQEAFGIVSENLEIPVIEDLDLSISPGELILVTGPSGSGKSLLFQALLSITGSGSDPAIPTDVSAHAQLSGRVPRVGTPMQCHPDVAPIDALDHLSLEEALRLMATAGLAEPQVLIRPSKTLSLGQKYRLSLALGIASDVELLLVDEFCESLDRFSAVAVARHLRRDLDATGRSALVATSRAHDLVSSLQPNRTLILASDGKYAWRTSERNII